MKFQIELYFTCVTRISLLEIVSLSILIVGSVSIEYNLKELSSIIKPKQIKPKTYALSSVYLIKLAETEEKLYSHIEEYAHSLKTRLELAQKYLEDFKNSRVKNIQGKSDNLATATDSIASYRMVRRLAHEFNAFADHLEMDEEGKLLDQIGDLEKLTQFPEKEDHKEAIESLLHLQYFYDLEPKDIVKGLHKNRTEETKHVGLTPNNAYELAEFSVKHHYYYLANQWLELLNKSEDQNPELGQGQSLQDLHQILAQQHDDNFLQKLENHHPYIYTKKILNNPNPLSLRHASFDLHKSVLDHEDMFGLYVYNYMALCNEESFVTEKEKSELHCWLDTKRNPYFTISPLKIDLLYKDPLLLQIHDVVRDKGIEEIRQAAMPSLERANKPKSPEETNRAAIYAWLDDSDIPKTKISRLNELISGLKVRGNNASELLQVASYAYGGHTSLHMDYLGPAEMDSPEWEWFDSPTIAQKGDRVSTFLVYLNEVEEGGYTAFPRLGTFVKPIKGSAVFWYTSLQSGYADLKMLHGACPIIQGHKWIATKWTHQKVNFLTRPCGLSIND